MSHPHVRPFAELAGSDAATLGGKGMNLAMLAAAGFEVPAGFCITAPAYQVARAEAGGDQREPRLKGALQEAVLHAYRALGAPLVAVRSSATAEDGAQASFAGQQETILGVDGEEALVTAVERCWHSLDSQRARAYRASYGIADDEMAMAVVVQRLVAAEVSGVLFTRDPLDKSGRQMLIEAARGLGEAVVSGRVQPDRYHVDRETGELLDQQLHQQAIMLTSGGEREIEASHRDRSSLDARQLARLAETGRKIEDFYGAPRDVEWAWAEGHLWILQARPITAATAHELEQARHNEMARLKELADPAGTVWSKYNLAEVLPEPTPMSWAVASRLMSGRGGFGAMYRDLGFDPDPWIDEVGIFDLVCGRPYVNLSREPLLYFRDFPYGHDFESLKANPAKAAYPTPAPLASRISWRFWWRLPAIVWQMFRNSSLLSAARAERGTRLVSETFPQFAARARHERQTLNWASLSPQELIEILQRWEHLTLFDFARDSLQSSLLAAVEVAELEQGIGVKIGPEAAAAEARSLLMGVRPDGDSDLAGALAQYVAGKVSKAAFLEGFGHRGPQEMELSEPRWREAPERLPPVTKSHQPHGDRDSAAADSEGELMERWRETVQRARIVTAQRERLEAILHAARYWVGLREAAKHHLLMGYELMRAALVELDRRFQLAGGIYFLTPDELPRLAAGEAFEPTIAKRRRERKLLLTLPVPPTLFSDDLEAIGRTPPAASDTVLHGTPISMGVFEGRAVVLDSPQLSGDLDEGFVLVCPSTDPAWVPLFLRAKALVMETGGVLSHGAIVAREFGLPAVAGIAQVHRRLRTGQRLRVDGTSGTVDVFDD